MRKFTDITIKDTSLEFKKSKTKNLSNDISDLDHQLIDGLNSTILDGEWEIVNVVDVSMNNPEINEAIIINAELGDKGVKRGDFIYITALINKKGNYIHQGQMGVIKCRVVEIYNTLMVLNQLK